MKSFKKVFSISIAICLIMCMMPLSVFAQNLSADFDASLPKPAPMTDEERAEIASGAFQCGKPEFRPKKNVNTDAFDTPEEAAGFLRTQLKNRVSDYFYVNCNVGEEQDDEFGVNLWRYLYYTAFAHTGEPDEGDYLLWHVYERIPPEYASSACYYAGNGIYVCIYYFNYNATYEQDLLVGSEVERVLGELDLEGKTEYQKFDAVYGWITDNIVYDYDNLGDPTYLLKHSAYAAMIDRKAVCQGYATLLYRMLLTEKVDCRVIVGIGGSGNNSGNHAWNIVRMGNLYYNVDSTWDAPYHQWNYAPYRLKCNSHFPEHDRDEEYETEEFNALYPMSPVCYDDPECGLGVIDCTNGKVPYSVDGYVVTVPGDVPCKLGYLNGDKYTAIPSSANADGSRSFTVSGTNLVTLVMTGDANLDGMISLSDSTFVKSYYNRAVTHTTMTPEEFFAGEVNGDNNISLADSTSIKAVYNYKVTGASFDWY